MTQIVARKNPVAFKTQAISVAASPEVLRYEPVGSPLSFAQMQERRRPLELDDPHCFEVTLANLGVSVDLQCNAYNAPVLTCVPLLAILQNVFQ